jgi:predicted transcriptional regulator
MPASTITINAMEAVKSIRSGMDDAALMEKFNISAEGLQSLFAQLLQAGVLSQPEMKKRLGVRHSSVIVDVDHAELETTPSKKKIIDAAEALKLIRSGASDAKLMTTYNLSTKGVQSLFKKLLGRGLMKQSDYDARKRSRESVIVDHDSARIQQRTDRDIDMAGFLSDIQAGASAQTLRSRYSLSVRELDALLNGLVVEKVMTREESSSLLSGPVKILNIKDRFTGKVIYSGQAPCIAALVEGAVAEGCDLSDAELSGLDLSRADFSGARLSRANLKRTNLLRSNLTGAVLSDADLQSSDMFGTILYKANLAGANLSDANLSMSYAVWAFMPGANLSEANLSHANFSGAHLAQAHVFEAILTGTNLTGAYLEGVNLESAKMRSRA